MEIETTNLNKNFFVLETFFDTQGYAAINALSVEEKKFCYCLSMAAIVGYPIGLFQFAPYPDAVAKIANYLAATDASTCQENAELYRQLQAYFLFLFSNYGVHNVRETENNKKVPADLKLPLVTPEALAGLGIKLSEDEAKFLFDKTFFPTATISEDIEHSGSHFYGKGFTTDLYNTLSGEQKGKLNAFFRVENGAVKAEAYSNQGVCGRYLQAASAWYTRALEVARKSPQYFDAHTVESLEQLVKFYESGDEEDFKAHSRAWLKMKNPKVEYNAGFIEYYDDPMSHIGTYQADVTVKSLNIDSLIKLLPSFEERFPFPREQKRKDMTILPNAAAAHKVMGLGGLGPVLSTIAYCLPNYNDMRSELGSKQVMYNQPSMSPEATERFKVIYFSEAERKTIEQYSPDLKLDSVIGSLCTTLHETIGHASGSNVEGVTNEIKKDNIGKWTNGLEEMRAEILALYTGIFFYDEIAKSGTLGDWPDKVPKEVMFNLMLNDIAGGGWQRWRSTPIGSTEVKQAHALADTGIMYYLIDNSDGALELREETVQFQGKDLPVLRLVVNDLPKLLPVIEKLAIEVQSLSSHAVFADIDAFMLKYAASTRNERYSGIVRDMQEAHKQGVLIKIQIFPEWKEHEDGTVEALVPQDAVGACLKIWQQSNYALSQ